MLQVTCYSAQVARLSTGVNSWSIRLTSGWPSLGNRTWLWRNSFSYSSFSCKEGLEPSKPRNQVRLEKSTAHVTAPLSHSWDGTSQITRLYNTNRPPVTSRNISPLVLSMVRALLVWPPFGRYTPFPSIETTPMVALKSRTTSSVEHVIQTARKSREIVNNPVPQYHTVLLPIRYGHCHCNSKSGILVIFTM